MSRGGNNEKDKTRKKIRKRKNKNKNKRKEKEIRKKTKRGKMPFFWHKTGRKERNGARGERERKGKKGFSLLSKIYENRTVSFRWSENKS